MTVVQTGGGRASNVEGTSASEAAVLAALREHGPATRAQLVTVTGLSRATVSDVVQLLLRGDHVSEERGKGGTEPGRPAAMVRLNPLWVDVVGLEIGRAHTAAAAADAADTLIGEVARSAPAEASILERTMAALELLDELVAEREVDLSRLRAVAVGTPGPRFTKSTRASTDLALTRTVRERAEVVEVLTKRFGVPVEVDNNTRCTALGEATSGAGAGARDLLYLRVDEGIGGGAVAGGALLEGHWGAAGEFGHVVVDPTGGRCPCGGRGCLELVAAMPALLAATGAADAGALTEGLQSGAYRSEVTRAARAVAQVLAGALASLDSSIVVIGGSVARLPGFLAQVEANLVDLAPSWCLADLSVRPAKDDRTAGARGCLVRARTRLESAPARSPRAIPPPLRRREGRP